MTFTTNLSVSTSILKEWISEITNGAKHTIYETPTFTQFIFTVKETVALTINLVLQNDHHVTILFLAPSRDVHDSIQVKFEGDLKLKLPIEEVDPKFKVAFLKEVALQKDLIVSTLQNDINFRDSVNERGEVEETRVKTAQLPSAGFNVSTGPRGSSRPSDMPDFDDEYEMLPKPTGGNPQHSIPSIGDDDLNPPSIGSNPLFDPRIGGTRHVGDGGMHPSLDHPLFRRGDIRRNPPHGLGVPPGARYDDPTGGGLGSEGFDGPAGPGLSGHFGPPHGSNSGAPGGFGGLSFGF